MEKFFKLNERGSNIRTELVAGVTTFLTMAYIFAVIPEMLRQTGMPAGGVFTATIIASAAATFFMGVVANLPFALAPGMGLASFFTYTVVLGMGYPWQLALAAVFVEGIVFLLMTFFNIREALIDCIPANLKIAITVGIGLFITIIGLSSSGLVTKDGGTIIALSKFEGSALVALIGIAVTLAFYALRFPGCVLISIFVTTLIGIPFGVTKVPENFSLFSTPSSPLFFEFDFSNVLTIDFFTVFFTFFFIDVFDTIGTFVGMATQAKIIQPDGKIPRVKNALFADAVGTTLGAAIGVSTVTTVAETSAGIAAGGKTGLTAVFTSFFMLLALFLSPIFLLIPSAATAPALILVGFLMMGQVTAINFKDIDEGIPAFLCIIIMPFAYSIADGIAWGTISYVLMKTVCGKGKQVGILSWILALIFLAKYFI